VLPYIVVKKWGGVEQVQVLTFLRFLHRISGDSPVNILERKKQRNVSQIDNSRILVDSGAKKINEE
jgi:hypothetical protein